MKLRFMLEISKIIRSLMGKNTVKLRIMSFFIQLNDLLCETKNSPKQMPEAIKGNLETN